MRMDSGFRRSGAQIFNAKTPRHKILRVFASLCLRDYDCARPQDCPPTGLVGALCLKRKTRRHCCRRVFLFTLLRATTELVVEDRLRLDAMVVTGGRNPRAFAGEV